MSSTAVVSSSSGRLRARVLVPVAVLLVPAVWFGPHLLAAGGGQQGFRERGRLVAAVQEGFVAYWGARKAGYSPELGSVVGYWFRFHVAKAAFSSALLVVLVALGVVVWRAFLRSEGVLRKGALVVAGGVVAVGGLLSLVVAAANVQGAVAPLTSVLTMLPVGARSGALGGTLAQVREGLAGAHGQVAPPLSVMIDDNTRYHVTMAVLAGVIGVGLLVVSVVLWRRSVKSAGRWVFGGLGVVLAGAVLLVGAANVTVAADPVRGLSDFYAG